MVKITTQTSFLAHSVNLGTNFAQNDRVDMGVVYFQLFELPRHSRKEDKISLYLSFTLKVLLPKDFLKRSL